jgi:hypothetical protein
MVGPGCDVQESRAMSSTCRIVMRAALVLASLCAAGCSSTEEQTPIVDKSSPLRLELQDLVRHFSTRVERAADDILAVAVDPRHARNAVFWKMRTIPNARAILEQADVQSAYVNLWVLVRGIQKFLEGQGQDYFGEHLPIALEAGQAVDSAVRAAGPLFLTEEKFALLEPRIDEFASQFATQYGGQSDPPATRSWDKTVSTVLEKPLDLIRVPLSWVNPGSGLSDTAAAVHRASDTVDGLRMEVDYLPSSVRWYVQLLLLELSENPAVKQAIDSFAQISASSARLSDTAARLPDDLTRVLTDLGEEQAGLQTTLRELQATLSGVDVTLTNVDRTTQSLTTLGQVWTGLVTEVDAFVARFQAPPGEAPPVPVAPATPEEPGKPFDIDDYTRASDSLAESARVLSALLGRVEGLTAPEQRVAIARTASSTVGSIVDRLLIGAALFVLFCAAVALGYRLALTRLSRGASRALDGP